MTAALVASCAKEPQPQTPAASTATTSAAEPLAAASANVLREQLSGGGVQTEYAAHFDGAHLTRIVEHRRIENSMLGRSPSAPSAGAQEGPLVGEYEFKGARLLRYRGAKPTAAAQLDLQFDLQGVLLSGQGPNVSDEDIRALRGRAQLLRSHALARRATQMH